MKPHNTFDYYRSIDDSGFSSEKSIPIFLNSLLFKNDFYIVNQTDENDFESFN